MLTNPCFAFLFFFPLALVAIDIQFTGGVDLNTKDHACQVPKPLLVAVEELGEIARATIKVLKENGAKGDSDYESEALQFLCSDTD